MRIPSEVIPLVENTIGKPKENFKAEPVRSASETGYELSHSAPKQNQYKSNSEFHRAQTQRGSKLPFKQESKERRKGERRKGTKPVLLDTRLHRSLRRKAEDAKISLKV